MKEALHLSWGKRVPDGTPSAKVLRWEYTWCAGEITKEANGAEQRWRGG